MLFVRLGLVTNPQHHINQLISLEDTAQEVLQSLESAVAASTQRLLSSSQVAGVFVPLRPSSFLCSLSARLPKLTEAGGTDFAASFHPDRPG